LDNIILKSLRKEPERRYTSVEQFSEDIRRHQIGLPVTASKDTWNYRAAKFVQRNRIGVAAACLILLTLLGGLLATLYQADKAQRRFDDVRQLANTFLFEFQDAIETLPGSTPARELVVKRALEYLDKLAQESGNDAALQRELATAYEKIGKIQGNSYYSNLGDTEGATKSVQTALEMREKLIAADPNNRDLQFELANSYQAVGDMLYTVNNLDDAFENYKKSLVVLEKLVADAPENLAYLNALTENHGRIGDISGLEGYPNLGDTPGAIENYRKAVSFGEKLTASGAASEKDALSYQNSLATWTTNLSMLESAIGDNERAIANAQKAIAVYEKITAANPNNTAHKLNALAAFNVIRYPLIDEMRFDEAEKYTRLTIKMLEEMSVADPKNTFIRRSLGVSYNALGRAQTEANNPTSALENHQKALRIAEELFQSNPANNEHTRDIALSLELTANAQIKTGEFDSALANYRKALTIYEKQSATGNSDDLAGVYMGIGKCLAATGNLREAAETFRRAAASTEKAARKSPLNVRKQSRLAIYYFEGGVVLAKLSQTLSGEERARISVEAKEWLEKSSKIFGELQSAGKLSKINAAFPVEVQRQLKQL
jgi:tetratricopeptide (TPR) repeat protein